METRDVVDLATNKRPRIGWDQLWKQWIHQKNKLKAAVVVDTITTRFLLLFLFLLSIPLASVILFTVSLLNNKIDESNALQLSMGRSSVLAKLAEAHQHLELLERMHPPHLSAYSTVKQFCNQMQSEECIIVDHTKKQLLIDGDSPFPFQTLKSGRTLPEELLHNTPINESFYGKIDQQLYLLRRSTLKLPNQQILYWGMPLNANFFHPIYSQHPQLLAEIWLFDASSDIKHFRPLLHQYNPSLVPEVSSLTLWKQLRQMKTEWEPNNKPSHTLPYLIEQEPLYNTNFQNVGQILVILPLNRHQRLLSNYYLGIYGISVASLIFSVLLAMAAGRTITQPLLKLIRQVNQLSRDTMNQDYEEILVGGVFEIQQLGQAFNRMLKRLRQEHRLRDEFVATLTHDLKVPLLAEKQTLTYLRQEIYGTLAEEQTEVIDVLKSSNRSCLSLVTGLLEVYRYDSGEVSLLFEMFSMEALLREIVQEFQALAQEKSIDLQLKSTLANTATEAEPRSATTDEEFEQADSVYADRLEIKRVLGNLISNAIINTSKHGVIQCKITNAENYGSDTIYKVSSFQYTSLKFPVKLTDRLMVSVQDSGLGFSSEDLDTLFKQFAANKSRNPMSIGLGLYNCHQVLNAHKGIVWVESTEGEGSLVSFVLPQNKQAAQDRRIFRDRRRIS